MFVGVITSSSSISFKTYIQPILLIEVRETIKSVSRWPSCYEQVHTSNPVQTQFIKLYGNNTKTVKAAVDWKSPRLHQGLKIKSIRGQKLKLQ